jgi:hypothetical protein
VQKIKKKINRFVYILTDFGIGSLVIIIYIQHYFLPIAHVIFILTQRLVPVVNLFEGWSSKVIIYKAGISRNDIIYIAGICRNDNVLDPRGQS